MVSTRAREGSGGSGDASSPVRGSLEMPVAGSIEEFDPRPGQAVYSFVTGPRGNREVVGEVSAEGRMPKVEIDRGEKLMAQTTVLAIRDTLKARLGL